MFDVYLRQAGFAPEKAINLLTSMSNPRHFAAKTALTERAADQTRQDAAEPQYIISLTSYHSRFASLARTLHCLDRQKTDKAYQIHVHLSDEDMAKKPAFRQVFDDIETQSTRVRFFYHAENLLSYKKLYYALQSHPQRTIITADDDVLYPEHWLSGLINKHSEHPRCIICYRGHYLESDDNGFKKYTRIMFKRTACSAPSYWLLPTGVSGVLYPPGSLDTSIALDTAAFMKLAPKADDFWFKLASLAAQTECVRVHTYNKEFPSVPFTQLGALAWSNTALGANDRVLKALNKNYAKVFDVLYKQPRSEPAL